MKLKKILGVLIALMMTMAVMPASPFAVLAEGTRDGVAYIDENGESQTCTEYTAVTGDYSEWSGWIVAEGDIYIDTRANVTGDVHLILTDGCTLDVLGGVHVPEGASFTVYGQEECTGVLNCWLELDWDNMDDRMELLLDLFWGDPSSPDCLNLDYASGIGSNLYHEDPADGNRQENSGEITINGGVIYACGWYAPGIGTTGGSAEMDDITINGGVVHAYGDPIVAPGIGKGWGGGYNYATIAINGGEVYAEGLVGIGDCGMGCLNIVINGGYVESTGISGRPDADYGCPVTITGGEVNVSAPLGDGTVLGYTPTTLGSNTLTITGGQVTATASIGCPESIGSSGTIVTLGWTNSEDFIVAPGISGKTVTLEKNFAVEGSDETFEAGVVEDTSALSNKKLICPGFHINVDDRTGGTTPAAHSIEQTALYRGEVEFTVSCENACAVGQLNADGTITRLACTTEDGVNKFSVKIIDSDVTIVIVIKGDSNLDGKIRAVDANMIRRVVAGTYTFSDIEAFAADTNADGKIRVVDANMIRRSVVGTHTIAWR